jgi:hypothetical protein
MLRFKPILFALVVFTAACNLTTEAPVTPTTIDTATPDISLTVDVSPTPAVPMLTPLRSTTLPSGLPPPPLVNVTPGSSGIQCAVYMTYSGPDPANLMSLRSQPSVNATQVFKVPNNAQVMLMPNSQEVETEGYHWLNVIYIDPAQIRYEGWMARDSYVQGGVRNPAISTLRATGQQSPC